MTSRSEKPTQQNPRYPSMDEILAERPELKPEIIQTLRLWKRRFYKDWNKLEPDEKASCLDILIEMIVVTENLPPIQIGHYCLYAWNPTLREIMVNKDKPSIISTLHELGHSIYGSSELLACRFSVWLFKEVFPRSYSRLKTNGHMLKS